MHHESLCIADIVIQNLIHFDTLDPKFKERTVKACAHNIIAFLFKESSKI